MLNASSLPRFKCFTICSNTPRPSKTQISGSAHKRAPVLLCPGLGCSLHKAPPRASPPVGDVRGDTTAWWAAVGTCLGGEGHKDSPMVRGWGLREGREPPPGHRGTAPGGLCAAHETRLVLSALPPRGCAIAPWALWLGARLQKKRRERTKHPPLPRLSVTMGTPPLRGPIRDDSTSPRAGGCVSAMARGRRPRASHKDLHSTGHGRGLHPSRSTPEEHPGAGRALVCCRKLSSSTSCPLGGGKNTGSCPHQPVTLSPSILLSKPNRVHLGAPATRARR